MPSAADIIRDSINEFSRLQNWMIRIKDIDPVTYESMHDRYIELKVILSSLGVNLSEIDKIKDQLSAKTKGEYHEKASYRN